MATTRNARQRRSLRRVRRGTPSDAKAASPSASEPLSDDPAVVSAWVLAAPTMAERQRRRQAALEHRVGVVSQERLRVQSATALEAESEPVTVIGEPQPAAEPGPPVLDPENARVDLDVEIPAVRADETVLDEEGSSKG